MTEEQSTMTPAQRLIWQALESLAGSKRSYAGSYSQLARLALVSEATVVRAMKVFAARGLVQFRLDTKRRRCGAIELL
jgi:DNA-binding MurR/RpiR family transcriptional regulator